MSLWVGDNGGVEAGFEFGKTEPFFVHSGIAGIIDAAKIKDVTTPFFGCTDGDPGEEGGGEVLVAERGSKGGPVGGNSIVVEDEERANESITAVAEMEISVFGERFEYAI